MYINASSSKGGGRNARETLTHSIRDCSTASSVFFFFFSFFADSFIPTDWRYRFVAVSHPKAVFFSSSSS